MKDFRTRNHYRLRNYQDWNTARAGGSEQESADRAGCASSRVGCGLRPGQANGCLPQEGSTVS